MSVVSFALAVVFTIRLFSTYAFRVPKLTKDGKNNVLYKAVCEVTTYRFELSRSLEAVKQSTAQLSKFYERFNFLVSV